MIFDLDDDQALLDDTIRRYVAQQATPARVRATFDDGAPGVIDDGLWAGLAALDVFGIAVPAEHGGSGRGLFELVLVADALGGGAWPGPFLEHVVATLAIAWGGDEEQRSRWLPGLLSGERRATLALAEPGERWLPGDWSMGPARLDGRKRAVLHPHGADVAVVGTAGGLALVALAQRGVAVEDRSPLDRTRWIHELTFEAVAAEPLAVDVADRVVDAALLLLAADAAGGARRCLELATGYAMEREQFGVTIGHFQAVKHQLADLALHALPVRHLVWHAAAATDAGRADARKLVALAKSHATDRYVDIGRRTIEVFGGIGYTWDCDAHVYLKRAVLDRAYLGAPAVHRRRVAALHGWPGARTK